MVRPMPKTEVPRWTKPSAPHSLTLHLRLITPLFGGGYEPREVDPVCIIRPAAIRGHLRFWWRALYGGQYASAKELFQAEAAIWGAAASKEQDWAGKVGLRVSDVRWNKQTKTVPDFRPRGSPAQVGPQAQYLLYTFQEQRNLQVQRQNQGRTEGASADEARTKLLLAALPESARNQLTHGKRRLLADVEIEVSGNRKVIVQITPKE